MMPSGQRGIDAVERLRKSQRELNRVIMEIVRPVDLGQFPNPYDDGLEDCVHGVIRQTCSICSSNHGS